MDPRIETLTEMQIRIAREQQALAQFKGGEFRGNVAAGVIPNGSRWEYRPEEDATSTGRCGR